MQEDAAVAGVSSTVNVVSGSIRNIGSGMRTGLLKAIDCVSCWCVLVSQWLSSCSCGLATYARLCIRTIVNVPYLRGAQV